jgi:hypothetical protein
MVDPSGCRHDNVPNAGDPTTLRLAFVDGRNGGILQRNFTRVPVSVWFRTRIVTVGNCCQDCRRCGTDTR